MATLDLSFISVLKVIPAVVSVLTPGAGQLLVLIKPQFEAGRDQVQYGGIVRDPAVRPCKHVHAVINDACASLLVPLSCVPLFSWP